MFSRYKTWLILCFSLSVVCILLFKGQSYAALQSEINEKNKIAEVDQILKSCNLEDLKKLKTELKDTQNEILKDKVKDLERLETVLTRVETNYQLALEALKLGDADDARRDLNNAKRAMTDQRAKNCTNFAEKIKAAESRAEQKLQDEILPAKRVLEKCDLKDLEMIEKKLKSSSYKRKTWAALKLEIFKARKVITTYNKAVDQHSLGQLDDAKSKLLQLNRMVKSDPQPLCKGFQDNVRTALHNIISIQIEYNKIEKGIQACDINVLNSAEITLNNKDVNPYYKPLSKDFKTKKDACFKTAADKNCQKHHGDKTEAIDIKTVQDHFCTCKAGFDFDHTKGECVKEFTREEVLRRAHQVCQKDYGRGAFAQFKDGQSSKFNCHCHKWFGWSDTDKRCVRRKSINEVLADGKKACTQKYGSFALAVQQNHDGTYTCQCEKGYNWSKTDGQCTKDPAQQDQPVQQVDAEGVCKKQFGDASFAKYKSLSKDDFMCYCKEGYSWNKGKSKCIEQSKQQLLSYGDTVCQRKYGAGSYAKRYQGGQVWECYIHEKR